MRFSLKNSCVTPRPLPSPPKIARSGTRTSVKRMWAWSVGMLNVQRNSTISKPGVSTGVRNAVMPSPSPALPLVRAKIRQCLARWMPVFHVFSPLMTHSSPSRTAVVSMHVASEPCSGSVMPKVKPPVPSSMCGIHSAFCSSVPWWSMSRRPTLLPTMLDSFCRSLWRPRPLRARCSRMIAIPRLRALLAAVLLRERVAVVAGVVGAAAHLAEQRLPLLVGQAAALPVGAGVLPAVVEEAVVVVLRLERLDLAAR